METRRQFRRYGKALVLAAAVFACGLTGSLQAQTDADKTPAAAAQDTGPNAPVTDPLGPPPGLTPDEATDILPDRGLVEEMSIWETPWFIIGVVLGVLLVAGVAIAWWLLRKQQPPPAEPPVPPIAIFDQAMLELRAARKLMEDGQDEAFSLAVSNVIRNYLERQFRIPAPERTTEEFLAEIVGNALIDDDSQTALRGFLEQCDLVKFARQTIALPQMEALYQTAEDFLKDMDLKTRMPSTREAALGLDNGSESTAASVPEKPADAAPASTENAASELSETSGMEAASNPPPAPASHGVGEPESEASKYGPRSAASAPAVTENKPTTPDSNG